MQKDVLSQREQPAQHLHNTGVMSDADEGEDGTTSELPAHLMAELERTGNPASIKTETMVVKREVREVVLKSKNPIG